VISFALSAAARAQATTTGSVDLTASNTRYGDTFSGNSLAISPALHIDAPSAVFNAGFTYSQLSGSWTTQGGASGSLFTPRFSSFMAEIAGSADGTAHADQTHTGSIEALGRFHALNDERGAWIGGGGGRVYDGTSWKNLIQGEVGAWTLVPNGVLSAVINPSKIGDTLKYTDMEASLNVFANRVGIDLDAGFRTGSALPITGGQNKAWGSATGTFWVTDQVAFIASAGTYPVNFGQGFPGGRFVSAGIRIGRIPKSAAGRAGESTPPSRIVVPQNEPINVNPAPATAAGTKLELRSEGGGMRRLSIRWPSASRLEITGDFTNWEPVPMRLGGDGFWTVTLPISSGIHEVNLRVDGGGWTPPPGLETKNDEFGGSVGLLLVGM